MKKIFLILIIVLMFFLSGCQNTVNEIGLTEKEANEYISFLTESIIYYNKLEDTSYDVELKYPNHETTYIINTEFGYIKHNEEKYQNINLSFNNNQTEKISWHIYEDYNLADILFFNIIIMENDDVIGYAIVKININKENKTIIYDVLKSVIFEEVINKDRNVSKFVIEGLIQEIINQNSTELRIKNTKTNEFFTSVNGSFNEVTDYKSVSVTLSAHNNSSINNQTKTLDLTIYINQGSLSNEVSTQVQTDKMYGLAFRLNIYFDLSVHEVTIEDTKLIILIKENQVTVGYFVTTLEDLCYSSEQKNKGCQMIIDTYNGVVPYYSDEIMLRHIDQVWKEFKENKES